MVVYCVQHDVMFDPMFSGGYRSRVCVLLCQMSRQFLQFS
jgi:hypothetical protein